MQRLKVFLSANAPILHKLVSHCFNSLLTFLEDEEEEDEWCHFPHLQPRAELRRNQRGEIGRQHIKGASGSRFSPL